MGKKPKLTPKQAKFVEGIAKGKNQTQAALEAYDVSNYETAAVIATENINKPNVKAALEPILAKHNISLETAIAPIGKALQATKVVITGNDKDGHFAEVVEDLEMQLKGSDRALKLMGIGQKDDTPQGNTFIQINNNKGSKYAD